MIAEGQKTSRKEQQIYLRMNETSCSKINDPPKQLANIDNTQDPDPPQYFAASQTDLRDKAVDWLGVLSVFTSSDKTATMLRIPSCSFTHNMPQILNWRLRQDASCANHTAVITADAAPSEASTSLEQVYRSQAMYTASMVLGSVAMVLSLGSMLFVHCNKHKQVVAVAQPPFLQLMCFGTLLLSISMFFIGMDEESSCLSNEELSIFCVVDTWTWYIGLISVYCSLFSKLLRVHKVTQLQRNQTILARHVIGPFLILMFATIGGVLIAYSIVDPPVWERGMFVAYDDDYWNEWDDVLPGETKVYGHCVFPYGYEDVLFALLVLLSCFLCFCMSWNVRKIPEEQSDGRRIFQSILTQIVITAVGLSIGYIIGGDDGRISLVIGMELLVSFLWVLTVIWCLLIIPKMYFVWFEWKHGQLPANIRVVGGGRVQVSGISAASTSIVSATSSSVMKIPQSSTPAGLESEQQPDTSFVTTSTLPEAALQSVQTKDTQVDAEKQFDKKNSRNAQSKATKKKIQHSSSNVITVVTLLAVALLASSVDASAVPDPFQLSKTTSLFSRRSRHYTFTYTSFAGSSNPYKQTMMVSSSKSKQKEVEERYPEFAFRDLGPVGKVVAGVTEIFFATLFEYLSGFMTGVFFGMLVGLPGFAFRPIEKGVRQPLLQEVKMRFSRMNTRSITWGKSFGSISAAFGGFGVAVRVIRNGEEDVWNSILSSAAAGAFFARKEGPEAMIRGALLYGGLIYLISGGGFGGAGKQLQEYTEKPVQQF
jgi:uncharacterized membrane protein